MKHLLAIPKAKSGQAVGEYGIVLSLVGIACISVLVLFGNTIQETLLNLGRQTTPKPAITQQDNKSLKISAEDISLPYVASSAAGSLSITLSNGQTVSLPNYPVDLPASLETNGANGTTELLSEQILALANALLKSNNLTPDQANILSSLAEQGHRIAAIEGIIGNTLQENTANSEPKTIGSLKFSYDGTLMNGDRISDLIGKHADPESGLQVEGPEIQKMKELLEVAQNTGALSDPAVNNLVSALTSDIIQIANKTESLIDLNPTETSLPGGNLGVVIASQVTNFKSDTICKADKNGTSNCR